MNFRFEKNLILIESQLDVPSFLKHPFFIDEVLKIYLPSSVEDKIQQFLDILLMIDVPTLQACLANITRSLCTLPTLSQFNEMQSSLSGSSSQHDSLLDSSSEPRSSDTESKKNTANSPVLDLIVKQIISDSENENSRRGSLANSISARSSRASLSSDDEISNLPQDKSDTQSLSGCSDISETSSNKTSNSNTTCGSREMSTASNETKSSLDSDGQKFRQKIIELEYRNKLWKLVQPDILKELLPVLLDIGIVHAKQVWTLLHDKCDVKKLIAIKDVLEQIDEVMLLDNPKLAQLLHLHTAKLTLSERKNLINSSSSDDDQNDKKRKTKKKGKFIFHNRDNILSPSNNSFRNLLTCDLAHQFIFILTKSKKQLFLTPKEV